MKFITPVLVLILILSVSVPFTPNVQAQNPNSLPDCEANSTLSSWLNFDFDEVNINFHDNWSLGDVNISIDISSPSSFYEYIDSSFAGLAGGDNSWISTDEFDAYVQYLMRSCLEDNQIMPGIALAPITSNDFGQNSTYEGPYAFHFDYDELQYTVELDGDVTRSCQNLGASADCVETIVSSNIPITIDLTIPIFQPNETILPANTNFQLAVDMSGLGNYSVDSSRPHTVSFSSNYSVELVAGSNINSTASVLGDTFQFRPSIGYCSGIFSWNNSQQQPSLPEASIMAFTAYQSEYYGSIFMDGSITMYWSVSGTMLPNDFISVHICNSDRSECSIEWAGSQNTYTYPGVLTKNGETYFLRVEVCNEVGCSAPDGGGSVFIQKENQTDSDGDGVPDDSDECPNTPAGSPVLENGCTEQVETDLDGDGYFGANDSFPMDANEWNDTDGDGVGDNADAFPSDENETHDDDNDGVGNNSDAFPDDPNENVDSDGDGVGDNADPEPQDPEIRTPDDINVEITNESAYLISGSILILAIVILFVRRKQPPQASHQISPFVSEDSMWND